MAEFRTAGNVLRGVMALPFGRGLCQMHFLYENALISIKTLVNYVPLGLIDSMLALVLIWIAAECRCFVK